MKDRLGAGLQRESDHGLGDPVRDGGDGGFILPLLLWCLGLWLRV